MKIIFAFVYAAFLLLSTGCNNSNRAVDNELDLDRQSLIVINNTYSIQYSTPWSKYRTPFNALVLTVDGEKLQSLYFFRPVADDRPMLRLERAKLPLYRQDMNDIELSEFIVDTLNLSGLEKSAMTNVEPYSFDQHPGIMLQFDFSYNNGLPGLGLAVATVIDDLLHVIVYRGTKEIYYDRYLSEVKLILDSIEIL